MKRIIELIIKIDDWVMKSLYDIYPELTKNQKDKK